MSRTTNRSSRVKAASLVGALALALNVASGAVAFADTSDDSGSASQVQGNGGGDGGHGDDHGGEATTYVNSVTAAAGATTAIAPCLYSGDVATGGGFNITGATPTITIPADTTFPFTTTVAGTIVTSLPVPSGVGNTPTAWQASVSTPLPAGEVLTAYVVCAHRTH
ncbi:hypothetical protein [Streptomyces sp. NPDC007264]|uniref:hypothetical protein n=1 Tax=Streptomyces sp. NPDC007264 TaxID=3364777 RepID=UPI0036DEE224